MNRLLLPLLLCCPLSVLGQGTIYFYNYVPSAGLNAPILDTDGSGVAGDWFRAQLFAGASSSTLNPVGLPADFALPTPGYWGAGFWDNSLTRVVPDVAAGETAHAQVRVWSILRGASYDQVATAGGKHGQSTVFTVQTGGETEGGTLPPSFPGYMTELRSFSLSGTDPIIPEPSTVALFALSSVALIIFLSRHHGLSSRTYR